MSDLLGKVHPLGDEARQIQAWLNEHPVDPCDYISAPIRHLNDIANARVEALGAQNHPHLDKLKREILKRALFCLATVPVLAQVRPHVEAVDSTIGTDVSDSVYLCRNEIRKVEKSFIKIEPEDHYSPEDLRILKLIGHYIGGSRKQAHRRVLDGIGTAHDVYFQVGMQIPELIRKSQMTGDLAENAKRVLDENGHVFMQVAGLNMHGLGCFTSNQFKVELENSSRGWKLTPQLREKPLGMGSHEWIATGCPFKFMGPSTRATLNYLTMLKGKIKACYDVHL